METEAGTAEGRRRSTPRESSPFKLLAAWAALTGKTQKAGAAFCSRLLWNTRGLEPVRSTGHAPYRTAGSLSSIEGKAAPAPPRSERELATWIRVHLRPHVSGRKLRTEETGKQKPNKQREPLQKGTCRWHRLHRKGPVDIKKCKLERGAIWNRTETTLTETAPEKFLDIF